MVDRDPGRRNIPETESSGTLRYTPVGYNERLAEAQLSLKGTDAAFENPMFSVFLGLRDTKNAIEQSVIDGTERTDVGGKICDDYYTAFQAKHDATRVVYGIEKEADDFLLELATPLFPEPPKDQWTTVQVEDAFKESNAWYMSQIIGFGLPHEAWSNRIVEEGSGEDTFRVPFTKAEIEAINIARDARRSIVEETHYNKKVRKEVGEASRLFPSAYAYITPEDKGLTDRRSAVWGIMTAARAAENGLAFHRGTPGGYQPGEWLERHLTTVRDLPDRLTRHTPPGK